MKEPPGTQVASETDLDFKPTIQGNGEHHENFVLRLVRTIRNNLFHGGKYPLRPVDDDARNPRLLEAGITVLEQCLDLSERVRETFKETG